MNRPRQRQWNAEDRFAFSTQRLRASTIPGRKHGGPTTDEWDYEEDDDEHRIQ